MKIKLKKFFYLMNDISNLALGKEINNDKTKIKRLKYIIVVLAVFIMFLFFVIIR